MKVLLINTFYAPISFGGAEQSVQLLAEGLVHAGHEVCVITTAAPSLPGQEIINGVDVRRVRQPNIYSWDGKARSPWQKVLWHAIDSFADVCKIDFPSVVPHWVPDIVNPNCMAGFGASSVASLARFHAPVIQTLRDYYFLCANATRYRDSGNCERTCTSCKAIGGRRTHFLKPAVDGFIGISQLVYDVHAEQLPWMRDLPYKIIPNGMSLSGSSTLHHRSVGKAENAPVKFGYLGRLSKEKGVVELVKGACQYKNGSSDNFTLHVGGDGPLMKYLKDEIVTSEAVVFEGRVRATDFLSTIDLLIVPSLWREPFGRVVIEAWRAGVPVVCSRSVGVSSYVDQGRDGLVYEGELVFSDDFMRQCRKLLAEDRLQERCEEKAQLFDVSGVAAATAMFFDEVANLAKA